MTTELTTLMVQDPSGLKVYVPGMRVAHITGYCKPTSSGDCKFPFSPVQSFADLLFAVWLLVLRMFLSLIRFSGGHGK